MADGAGRPRTFLPGSGSIADITVAPGLLRLAPPCRVVLADRGCDARALRQQAADAGAPARLVIGANHLKAYRTAAGLPRKGLFPAVPGAPEAA